MGLPYEGLSGRRSIKSLKSTLSVCLILVALCSVIQREDTREEFQLKLANLCSIDLTSKKYFLTGIILYSIYFTRKEMKRSTGFLVL